MSVEQLLQQQFDGSWSGHDTILALSHFQQCSLRSVSDLRTLSDGQWQQLRLASSLERSLRLYLLSTAHIEQYATRMNLPSASQYSQDLLREPLYRESDLGQAAASLTSRLQCQPAHLAPCDRLRGGHSGGDQCHGVRLPSFLHPSVCESAV